MTSLAGVGVWVRRIVDVTLIALILVVLFAVALSKLAPMTGRQTIAVGGSSMEPAIHLGAAMIVGPVDPAALSVGDVVYLHGSDANGVFTHRIVAIVDQPDGRYVQTKGDASPDPDPTLVAASAIIGRVEFSIPLMGFVLALLSVPAGVIFVLSLAATLLALAGLLDHLDPQPAGRRRVHPAASDVGSSDGTTVVGPAPSLMPVTGGMTLQLVAPGTRTPLLFDPSSRPRPTAREQIARSRETRNQRDRRLRRNEPSETTD
jgi:signal peptidase I